MSARRPLLDRVASHYEREARRARAAARRATDPATRAAWITYADRVQAAARRSIVRRVAA